MKLSDLLKEKGIELGKVYTDKDRPPFVNEAVKNKYASIYKMKEEMEEGKFDPKNPTIHIHGWGVIDLDGLHRWIARDLGDMSKNMKGGRENDAKNTEYLLYRKHSPLEAKVKGLNEVYKQMNSPQYKRAVTMYKRKR